MKYDGNWSSLSDIKGENYYNWQGFPDDIKDEDVIYANYDTPSYEGSAYILFKKDGKFYEAYDSHCSCYGLENWSPEETTIETVKARPSDYHYTVSNLLKAIEEAGL